MTDGLRLGVGVGMTAVFWVSFIAGMFVAVRIMLFGVEKVRSFGAEGERSFRLSTPLLATFLMVYGLAGWLLVRALEGVRWGAGIGTIAAALVALAATEFMRRAIKRWWLVTPEHDVDDERYVLQGHLARVTEPIGADGGAVTFQVDSVRRDVRARSIDDLPIAAGADVVIERLEDDVAWVERWDEVEKRL
jgi:hypothetical protein